jgi:tRNA pseudouridine38-40 synthase
VFTYRITVEYDGTDFHGWQFQPAQRTVEGALRDAVRRITGEMAVITAAGRTDAGAHAHGQVAGLTIARIWQPARLAAALNALLPPDVAVSRVELAKDGFHARRDAISRTYKYVVAPRQGRTAVTRRHAWTVRGPLDVGAMQAAAAALVGTHDFASFGRPVRPGGSTVRSVHEAAVQVVTIGDGPPATALEYIILTVRADAFLRGMMRAFAGAIVAAGQGQIAVKKVAAMADAAEDAPSRLTVAPAHGLHQWSVDYTARPDTVASAA